MSTNTGGPAFPVSSYVNVDGQTFQSKPTGMTLRDYFAAAAMQGFASDPTPSWEFGLTGMARCAYDWADAMLKERAK